MKTLNQLLIVFIASLSVSLCVSAQEINPLLYENTWQDKANLRWYFIIIRSIDDKGKIWEYDLPYKAPQNPVNNGWWNYTTINIPVELPEKFYIYLNDKKSEFLSDFKFLIEKNN